MLTGELGQLSIGFSYLESTTGQLRGLAAPDASVVRAGANPLARIESAIVSPICASTARSRITGGLCPIPSEEHGIRFDDVTIACA